MKRPLLILAVLIVAASPAGAQSALTQTSTTYTIVVPNRAYMEMVRDAIHMWELEEGEYYAASDPKMVWMRELRQDIGYKFVGRHPGEEW